MDSWSIKNHSFYNRTQIPFSKVISSFCSFTNIYNLVLDVTFPNVQNNHPNAPNFKTQPNCHTFSHPKFNPVTKTTQILPKRKEEKVEKKRCREKGEADSYKWWWWPRWAPLPNRYLSFSYRGRASCLHIGSVWIEFIFAETENWNWKHCSKIIFKYVNSIVGPIFNEKVVKK